MHFSSGVARVYCPFSELPVHIIFRNQADNGTISVFSAFIFTEGLCVVISKLSTPRLREAVLEREVEVEEERLCCRKDGGHAQSTNTN